MTKSREIMSKGEFMDSMSEFWTKGQPEDPTGYFLIVETKDGIMQQIRNMNSLALIAHLEITKTKIIKRSTNE